MERIYHANRPIERGHSLVEAVIALCVGVLVLATLLSGLAALQFRLQERMLDERGRRWRLASDPFVVRAAAEWHAAFVSELSRSDHVIVVEGAADSSVRLSPGTLLERMPRSESELRALTGLQVNRPDLPASAATLFLLRASEDGAVLLGRVDAATATSGEWSFHSVRLGTAGGRELLYEFSRRSASISSDRVEIRRTRLRTGTAQAIGVEGPVFAFLPDPRRGSGAWSATGRPADYSHVYLLPN